MESSRAPAKPVIPDEQRVDVALDYENGVCKLSVRGKYDIRPTDVLLPFAVLDRIQWQRLTVQLQQLGVIPGDATNNGGKVT